MSKLLESLENCSMNRQINLDDVISLILQIIEGAAGGDKDKIKHYGERIAKKLDEKGYYLTAMHIRELLYVPGKADIML